MLTALLGKHLLQGRLISIDTREEIEINLDKLRVRLFSDIPNEDHLVRRCSKKHDYITCPYGIVKRTSLILPLSYAKSTHTQTPILQICFRIFLFMN